MQHPIGILYMQNTSKKASFQQRPYMSRSGHYIWKYRRFLLDENFECKLYKFLDLTRNSFEKCNHMPSGRNQTCAPKRRHLWYVM
jgi:hypothetical protein